MWLDALPRVLGLCLTSPTRPSRGTGGRCAGTPEPVGDHGAGDPAAIDAVWQGWLRRPAGRAGDPAALAVLGLLRACLEYRFGADVVIGDGMPPVPGADDIALSTPARPVPDDIARAEDEREC